MYRLLLVDDEAEILDWLFELFQDVQDIELDVCRALSGYEALDILERTKIDVILSDIRMPGLNGLQLMEKVRGRWPQCRIIFLTGYSDFDSIYTAVQAEGVSYLLKTEEDERIVYAVRHAVQELERGARDRELQQRMEEYLAAMLPYQQRDYVRRLVRDAEEGPQATQEALDELSLELCRDAPLYAAAASFDRAVKAGPPLATARPTLSLRMRADELFGPSFVQVCAIQLVDADAVWLLQPREEGEPGEAGARLGGVLEALQDFSRENLGLTLSAAYWSGPVAWDQLVEVFQWLSALLGAGENIGMELLLNERSFSATRENRRDYLCLPVDWSRMDVALERGNTNAFMQVLTAAATALRGRAKEDPVAQEIYYRCAATLLGQINRRLGADVDAVPGASKLLRAGDHGNWDAAADYLLSMGKALFNLQRGVQQKTVHESVERIKEYIRAHLGEDLSLVRLAELFYFNPSYLSRLFKQATGRNLIDYITQLRVERAQTMLLDHRRRIGDIATALGFESQHYFARFFKKATGMAPQEYREHLLRSAAIMDNSHNKESHNM